MYSIQMIQKEVINTCRNAGVSASFLPIGKIKINTRFKTTLGRVSYNGSGEVIKVEFNKDIIEKEEEDVAHQVILHECAHIIALYRDGVNHGHDKFFKAICSEIGCTFDKISILTREKMEEPELTKYTVTCPHCNEVIGRYKRWCPTLEHLSSCTCARCGNGNLKLKQNW